MRTGLRTVALAGGVFQNALLLEELLPRIGDHHVLLPHCIPPNDGGIAYGQAAVALARMRCHAQRDGGGALDAIDKVSL